jgi:hypothetical protein
LVVFALNLKRSGGIALIKDSTDWFGLPISNLPDSSPDFSP